MNKPSRSRKLVSQWIDDGDTDRRVDHEHDDSVETAEIATELVVHGLLKELADRDAGREDHRIGKVLQAIDAGDAENRLPDVSAITRPITIIALAASVLLAIGIGALLFLQDGVQQELAEKSPVPPPGIASVAQVIGAEFADAKELKIGDRLSSQTIQLNSGFVRIAFDDGVEVTLQGPAEYELIKEGKTRLNAGLLTANVPPGAEGFTVDTPDAEVVDLGTSFGIDLREDGVSHVSVFEGKVEVSTSTSDEKHHLSEGEAVSIKSGEAINAIEFDSDRFRKAWPVSSGIERSTESVRFIPPWPRQVKQIRSDTEIFILPEGRPVTLEMPLLVNATEPGTYATEDSLEPKEIGTGKRIRSFLLMCHPEKAGPFVIKPVSGSITFDSPVLGMIIRHEEIQASARRFLRRGPRLIQPEQQLELNGETDRDVLVLSDDRRTLSLDLKVRTRFGEMLRVIVDASDNTKLTDSP